MRRPAAIALAFLLASSTSALAATASGFAPGKTTLASVASDGTPANAPVASPILSRDGRYVVFVSSATDLAAGANGTPEVYRHDRVTGITDLVSVALTGGPEAAGASAPTVSADGRFVAFNSAGADLVDGDTNGVVDVFVRDMTNGTTVAATTTSSGAFTTSGGGLAGFPGARSISDDGRYVVFSSVATELTASPNGGVRQVYVKDLTVGSVALASADASGNAGNASSAQGTISGDGHVVAFQTASTNLSPLIATSGGAQVYVRDLVAGVTTLESLTSAGAAQTFFPASTPGLSYDGRYLAFETQAQLGPSDLDGAWDVYLRDRAAGTTTLASASANTSFGVDSRAPAISSDGAYVAFHSVDPTIVSGDTNGAADVFLYGRDSGQLTLVSLNDAGVQANASSMFPSLSADGTKVLFQSSATDLVTSPSTTGVQLYVRDLATDQPPVVSAGGNASVAEGVAFTRTGRFSDPDSTSWTASVDWGDGAGPQPLALASDGTFTLNRLLPVGTYSVAVAVTDEQGQTGTDPFTLAVTNVAPAVTVPAGVQLAFASSFTATGSFTDPGTNETDVATVDYGDGTGPQPLALAGDAFALSHAYPSAPGSYVVVVAVTDSNGGTGTGTFTVSVLDDSYAWLSPTPSSANAGRSLPVHFSVTAPNGSPIVDQTVRVDLLDQSGNTVSGPYFWSTSPSTGVVYDTGVYEVTIDTSKDGVGSYTLRVSFASPTLTGSFTRAIALTSTSSTTRTTR